MNSPSAARGGFRFLRLGLLAMLALSFAAGARADEAKLEQVRAKLMKLTIPRLQFREATVRESLEFLKQKSRWLDPQAGPNLTLKLPADEKADARINLSLTSIPVWEALRYVAVIARLKISVSDQAIELTPEEANAAYVPPLASEAGPTRAKLGQIIIPRLELREATLGQALEFLSIKAAAVDVASEPARRGVNIVQLFSTQGWPDKSDVRITLKIENAPLGQLLDSIAEQARLDIAVEDYAVVVQARPEKK